MWVHIRTKIYKAAVRPTIIPRKKKIIDDSFRVKPIPEKLEESRHSHWDASCTPAVETARKIPTNMDGRYKQKL
ncbi:hypothetical protein EVAR_92207_1 [Eumeta japonica]|uniref:Uncharacterized protein n=1 Tax=Eumeta variegata TaxID=151549 RepID=A0A4C1TN62_EUMVA|nr:hypothetical protein EVAR_92207_1 [Eumeta japonica]